MKEFTRQFNVANRMCYLHNVIKMSVCEIVLE
jgi:hypothetical protein